MKKRIHLFIIVLLLALAIGITGAIATQEITIQTQDLNEEKQTDTNLLLPNITEYAELQKRENELSKISRENLEGSELRSVLIQEKALMVDYADYYAQYGWKEYIGPVFDASAIIYMVEDELVALDDLLIMAENGIMPTGKDQTKDELINFFKAKIGINKDFLQKLSSFSETSSQETLQALSGEYQFLYYLEQNRIQLTSEALKS